MLRSSRGRYAVGLTQRASLPSSYTHNLALYSFASLQSVRISRTAQTRAKGTNASSGESTASAPSPYAHTLNLPKTDFALRSDWKKLEESFKDAASVLYKWQESDLSRKEMFVLHDGPPYANGPLHIGHALNKILKDLVVRYKLMRGYKISFIPGWDCHGLPIENKVEKRHGLPPEEIRKKANAFADEAIDIQRKNFKRWGIMADWDHPYTTKDKDYEASQLGLFMQLYKKGHVFRGIKPVLWSPSSRTALAEAEVEYDEKHISKALYVAFPLKHTGKHTETASLLADYPDVRAVIWTTTPWTIPANKAISVSPDIEYCVVQDGEKDYYLIAKERVNFVEGLLGRSLDIKKTLKGSSLKGCTYVHPLDGRELPFLLGSHVSTTAGTGLVHTAPAHGEDDFRVCHENGIDFICEVDEQGKYMASMTQFAGLDVLGSGNDAVIEALKQATAVVKEEKYQHKYPYDWRTKKPVIVRATRQWFIGLDDLVRPAIEAIADVNMVPPQGKTRLEACVGGRQEWCISRQRVWGVPIPVFYDSETGDHLITEDTVSHVQELVKNHGTDCWWSLPVEELLHPSYRNNGKKYIKGTDTMDVWLDSGVSWNSALRARGVPFPADLYLEGSDQHRGWFQSSLITSVAITGKSPYKTLVTNGFVLDEKARKMSKSLGNVIEPSLVIEGGKGMQPCGVDGLRMWVAATDYTKDIMIGPAVMETVRESLRRVRNTSRFLLGNLFDFDASKDTILYENLPQVDKYMLHELHQFSESVTQDYEQYNFNKVVKALSNFSAIDLSSFYFEVIKDRVYSERPDDVKRRAAQYVLAELLDAMVKALGPIAPFTAEDIYRHAHPKNDPASLFKSSWMKTDNQWHQPELAQRWQTLRAIRSEVYKVMEVARAAKSISTGLDAKISLEVPSGSKLHAALSAIQSEELADLFVTPFAEFNPVDNLHNYNKNDNQSEESSASSQTQTQTTKRVVQQMENGTYTAVGEVDKIRFNIVVEKIASHHKCVRCWKWSSTQADSLCPRCVSVTLVPS